MKLLGPLLLPNQRRSPAATRALATARVFSGILSFACPPQLPPHGGTNTTNDSPQYGPCIAGMMPDPRSVLYILPTPRIPRFSARILVLRMRHSFIAVLHVPDRRPRRRPAWRGGSGAISNAEMRDPQSRMGKPQRKRAPVSEMIRRAERYFSLAVPLYLAAITSLVSVCLRACAEHPRAPAHP